MRLTFRILEKGDGFAGQVIFAGSPDAKLVISVVIEGVRAIEENDQAASDLLKRSLFPLLLPGSILFLLAVLCTFLLFAGDRQWEKIFPIIDPLFSYIEERDAVRKGIKYALILTLLIGAVIALLNAARELNQKSKEGVVELVPSSLRR